MADRCPICQGPPYACYKYVWDLLESNPTRGKILHDHVLAYSKVPSAATFESDLRFLRLARACPYRDKEPGCCTGYLSLCYRSQNGRVTEFDCIECMRELNPSAHERS